jgi:hypothetical protein
VSMNLGAGRAFGQSGAEGNRTCTVLRHSLEPCLSGPARSASCFNPARPSSSGHTVGRHQPTALAHPPCHPRRKVLDFLGLGVDALTLQVTSVPSPMLQLAITKARRIPVGHLS